MNWFINSWFLLLMLFLGTAFSFGYLFAFCRKTLHAKWYELLIVSFIHTIFGVFCVKFWAMLETGFALGSSGKMSLYGGLFLMPIFYAVYAIIKKIPFKKIFDIFTICLASTLFMARINCIHSGCCNGLLIQGTNIHIPTREMELVFYGVFIIFNFKWIIEDRSNGKVYPLFLLSYGIFRFITEFLREYDGESLFHRGHIWSIVSIVIGITLLVVPIIKNKKIKESNKEG